MKRRFLNVFETKGAETIFKDCFAEPEQSQRKSLQKTGSIRTWNGRWLQKVQLQKS